MFANKNGMEESGLFISVRFRSDVALISVSGTVWLFFHTWFTNRSSSKAIPNPEFPMMIQSCQRSVCVIPNIPSEYQARDEGKLSKLRESLLEKQEVGDGLPK